MCFPAFSLSCQSALSTVPLKYLKDAYRHNCPVLWTSGHPKTTSERTNTLVDSATPSTHVCDASENYSSTSLRTYSVRVVLIHCRAGLILPDAVLSFVLEKKLVCHMTTYKHTVVQLAQFLRDLSFPCALHGVVYSLYFMERQRQAYSREKGE